MPQSVKANYILNLINTGTQMLFPLITFPYACRVIQAKGDKTKCDKLSYSA